MIAVIITRVPLLIMASGTIARKRIQRTTGLRSTRYPKPAASASSDIKERIPLHASTTSRVMPGKISTLPSRDGEQVERLQGPGCEFRSNKLQRENDFVVNKHRYRNSKKQEGHGKSHGAQHGPAAEIHDESADGAQQGCPGQEEFRAEAAEEQ